jgi:glycosyltransferase involved in cell wall biosynthesis
MWPMKPAPLHRIIPVSQIVHYIHELDQRRGGIVRAVLGLSDLLAASGIRVTIITHGVSPELQLDSSNRIEIVQVPAWYRSQFGLAVHHVVKDFASDAVVHLHSIFEPGSAAMGFLLSRAGLPYVISPHGSLDDWSWKYKRWKKRPYWSLVGKRLVKNAGLILYTAPAEREQAERRIAMPGTGHILPLPLDPQVLDYPIPDVACPTGAPQILFMSRIHPKKGLDRLIRALPHVLRAHKDARLRIAGEGEDGYVRELECLAMSNGVDNHIDWLGFLHGQVKLHELSAADALVLPSFQENFAFVLFEALALGTRVLTTTAVDTWPDLAKYGSVVINTSSPTDISGALIRILDERGSFRRQDVAYRVRGSFSQEKLADRYSTLYSSVRVRI